jgi:LysR family glycine cleavage system transcriptional activator
MSMQLPPLNPLRAFEAAARHGSVLLAASEMHVTPSAVSHQIRALELALDVPLFRRLHRGIELTPAGETYYLSISPLMRQIGHATEQLRPRRAPAVLHICGYATFTMRWLIPRLVQFHALHPEVEVRVRTVMEDIDFSRSPYDAAIRSGSNDWPGLRSICLAPIRFVPVCSPRLLAACGPIRQPRDLSRKMLLHSMARPDAWRRWLHHACGERVDVAGGIVFENSGLCYQAALEGLGVALAQEVLVQDELAAGTLVRVFDTLLDEGESYYFVAPRSSRSHVLAPFEEWLREAGHAPAATPLMEAAVQSPARRAGRDLRALHAS